MAVLARGATTEPLQAAAAATGNGTPINMTGQDTLVVDVTGTFVGTVTFEGTIDDTNWVAVGLLNVGTGAIATTATAAGMFKMPVDLACLSQFRARVSAYTSGAITVNGRKGPD